MTSPAAQRPPARPPAVSAVPAAGERWRDLDEIDRIWAGVCYTRSVTSVDVPPADRVRAALAAVAHAAPELGRWVTPDQVRWRPVEPGEQDAWLAEAFTVSEVANADPEQVAALNAAPPQRTPFRVMVGPDWISVRAYHSMGDGWSVDRLIGVLLSLAGRAGIDAGMDLPWHVVPRRERDRLIRREVRSHARAALWAARHRAELAGGVYEPIGPDLAPGRERVVELVSPDEFPAVLRRLRDELTPGVSAAALGMVGLRAALAGEVGRPAPGFECLFNTRSAAAATGDAWGNFSAGIFICPEDDYDPAAVAAQINRVRRSGLPEVAHASLRLRGRSVSAGPVSMPRATGAPRMTMSYMQAHTMDPVLPGLRRNESRVGTVSRPNGIDSISVQQVECAGRTHVAVSFFPHRWEADAVVAAMTRFFGDPRSCLADASSGALR